MKGGTILDRAFGQNFSLYTRCLQGRASVFSSCCPRLGVRGSPRLHRKANREEALEIKATDVTITQCAVLLAFPTLAWR